MKIQFSYPVDVPAETDGIRMFVLQISMAKRLFIAHKPDLQLYVSVH
ncbi:hypothetical protein [Aeribacillus sp. FSL M8-0235]